MNETLAAQDAPKTASEHKGAIDFLLGETRRINKKFSRTMRTLSA